MLGYVKRGTDYDLREILVRLLGGMVVDTGHLVSLLEQIALEVLQPEPVTRGRKGAHEEYPSGGAKAGQAQQQEHQPLQRLHLHLICRFQIKMRQLKTSIKLSEAEKGVESRFAISVGLALAAVYVLHLHKAKIANDPLLLMRLHVVNEMETIKGA